MKTEWHPPHFSDGDRDQDLYSILLMARSLVFRAREIELEEIDMTPEQTAILFFVRIMKDRATPAEISRAVIRQPHTVSSIVDRMEKKGLVEKVKDLSYKNMVRIKITDKGEEMYRRSTKRRAIHNILSVLNDEERSQLNNSLEKLIVRAGKELGLKQKKTMPKRRR